MEDNNNSSNDENMLDTQDMSTDMEADRVIDIGNADTDEPETIYVDATVENVDNDSNETYKYSKEWLRDELINDDSPNETYDYIQESTEYGQSSRVTSFDDEYNITDNEDGSSDDDNKQQRSITARIADAAQSDTVQKARAGTLKAAKATGDAIQTAVKSGGKAAIKTGKTYWNYTGSVADETPTPPNIQPQMQPQRMSATQRNTGTRLADRDLYEPTAPRVRRQPTPEMIMGARPGPNDGINVNLEFGFSDDSTQYQQNNTYDLTFGFTDDAPESQPLNNQALERSQTINNQTVRQSQQPIVNDFGFSVQQSQPMTDNFGFNFDSATMMSGGELSFFDADERRGSAENDFEFFGGRLL